MHLFKTLPLPITHATLRFCVNASFEHKWHFHNVNSTLFTAEACDLVEN